MSSAAVVQPPSARYMSVLACTCCAEKIYRKSIEPCRQSADFANRSSSGNRRNEDLGRAWRGKAGSVRRPA